VIRRLVVAFVLALMFGLASAAAWAEPPNTHEILTEKPSGFWTSNRPAVGGAYRYRLMAIGGGIAAIMGFVIWRVIKNNTRR
jgi:hypothetical protein